MKNESNEKQKRMYFVSRVDNKMWIHSIWNVHRHNVQNDMYKCLTLRLVMNRIDVQIYIMIGKFLLFRFTFKGFYEKNQFWGHFYSPISTECLRKKFLCVFVWGSDDIITCLSDSLIILFDNFFLMIFERGGGRMCCIWWSKNGKILQEHIKFELLFRLKIGKKKNKQTFGLLIFLDLKCT